MAQHAVVLALFISTVLSARTDDENFDVPEQQPTQQQLDQGGVEEDPTVAEALKRLAETTNALQHRVTPITLENPQEGVPWHIKQEQRTAGVAWDTPTRGVPWSVARTAGADANTADTHFKEAEAARISAHNAASHVVCGAEQLAGMAKTLANKQAMENDRRIVKQIRTQTSAQWQAQEWARSHAHEAALAHKKMIEAQETEKMYIQEAKLAHAEAVTEGRALAVHTQAERRINEIEVKRAHGIHDINTQADHEVATAHGGALNGIERAFFQCSSS